MSRNFDEWLSQFRESISSYDYYIDFEKVYENVDSVKVELNILNSLIGSKSIEDDFKCIVARYPEVLKCIPILLAVRQKEIFAMDGDGAFWFDFKECGNTVEEYTMFMRKTGLFGLIENHIVNNLYDYVTGVETGLDSNGRKNRGGHQMEDLVEKYIISAGIKKAESVSDFTECRYHKEMYLSDVEETYGLDLSSLSNDGKARKRFDYVVKVSGMVYGIETNFYAGGGSKLNETARSYKMLAQEAEDIDGFTFLWITDGCGWKSAKGNLRETFEQTEYVYNIAELDRGVLKRLFA